MLTQTFALSLDPGRGLPPLPDLDSEETLLLLFGASACLEHPGVLQEVVGRFPRAKIVGCSTAGEILGRSISDDGVVGAVCRFAHTRLRTSGAPIPSSGQSSPAGRAIAEALSGPDLRGILIISDGLQVNGTELLRGMTDALPDNVVITGGLAGDGSRFKSTWTLRDGRPASGWVSAVGFYGERIHIGHGSSGGWDIFGPERRVTRSHGNVLFEIDGHPALELYKRYLGELAAELPSSALLFPLSLRRKRDASDSVVRTILSIDEAERSMTFAGDIPEGSLVQLMRANFDRLVDGAQEAARLVKPGAVAAGSLAIAISCVGRRLVLRERAEEEVEVVKDLFSPDTQLVGFYSYGEISPYASGRCDLHNQTMTLTHLSED
jgi:hypothetical protein